MSDELRPGMDIETLVARIRERAAQRNGTALAPTPARSQVGTAAAGLSHPDQPADALAAQADFNHALVASLGSLASCLQELQASTAAIRRQVEREAEHGREARRQAAEQVERLMMMAQEEAALQDQVRRRLETAVAAIQEPLRTTTERLDALTARTAEIGRLADAAAAESAAVEKRLGERVDQTAASWGTERAGLEARLAAIERRLDEATMQQAQAQQATNGRIDEIAVAMEAVQARVGGGTPLSDLERHLRHELDTLHVGLLRARRLAGRADAGPAAGSAEARDSDEAGRSPNAPADAARAGCGPAGGAVPAAMVPFDYFMFEGRFRGSVPDIKERQRAYVDLFRGRKNVVDLGCGRGEFVELLTEHGVPVVGVDRDEDMLDLCRERGLRVVQADLLAYLESLPDGSLDSVFCAQVVEHMPPDQILRLIDRCGRKLAPGGLMVAETPNPNCPAALGSFYLDPTHVRPVPAALLGFLFEQCGYTVQSIRFSAPLPGTDAPPLLEAGWGLGLDLPIDITNYGDYAVIAAKP